MRRIGFGWDHGAFLAAMAVASQIVWTPAQAQCTGSPPANTVCAGVASGSPVTARFRALVPADVPTGKMPTVQRFTTAGTFSYASPTNPAPIYIKVSMIAGGGGGAGASPGQNGTASSFADWTCAPGTGGTGPAGASGGQPGSGGSGGTDGTGVLIDRASGGSGQVGVTNTSTAQVAAQTARGGGFFGQSPAPGAGGQGGAGLSAGVGSAGSGGAGEWVSFMMTPGTYSGTVGAGGVTGTSSTVVSPGNDGQPGKVVVEEIY